MLKETRKDAKSFWKFAQSAFQEKKSASSSFDSKEVCCFKKKWKKLEKFKTLLPFCKFPLEFRRIAIFLNLNGTLTLEEKPKNWCNIVQERKKDLKTD